MNKKEIKKLLEAEKAQFKFFLKMAKRLKMPDEYIEKQSNFYLDKINELLKQIDNGSSK